MESHKGAFWTMFNDIGRYDPAYLSFAPSHFHPEMGAYWAILPLGMVILRAKKG